MVVPKQRIGEFEALSEVLSIQLPKRTYPNRGSAVTERDTLLDAPQVRELGKMGQGVKVLVIAEGANSLTKAQAANDLPTSVTDLTPTGCDWEEGCNEGTAMLEIIHDIAPETQLGICGANNDLEFIECVSRGIGEGFDVMVDDLSNPFEPFFEDGPVARQIERAVEKGVLFVSDAGNWAQKCHETDFIPPSPGDAIQVHDFGLAAGEEYQWMAFA